MTIRIGALQIEDKNHNDVFDPQVDQIKNEKGEVLRLDSQEVKQAMKDLGVQFFRGLRISTSGMFMLALKAAEQHAAEGNPDVVAEYLERARKFSPVPFDERRAETILKSAYQNGIEACLRKAQEYSEKGYDNPTDVYGRRKWFTLLGSEDPKQDPVDAVQDQLAKANELCMQSGIEFDGERAEKIRHQAYQLGIEMSFEEAENNPSRELIEKIKKHGKEGNIEIDASRLSVLEKYLEIADQVQQMDRNVEALKQMGEVDEGERNFEDICEQKFGKTGMNQMFGEPHHARTCHAMILDLAKSYIRTQNELRKAVQAGDVDKVKDLLRESERIATEFEEKWQIDLAIQSVDPSAILDKARRIKVEQGFSKAEAALKAGKFDQVHNSLQEAYEDAAKEGVYFDGDRAKQMEESIPLLQETYRKLLDKNFSKAEESLKKGNFSQACTEAGRALEKSVQEGVPFDMARERAGGIKITARRKMEQDKEKIWKNKAASKVQDQSPPLSISVQPTWIFSFGNYGIWDVPHLDRFNCSK